MMRLWWIVLILTTGTAAAQDITVDPGKCREDAARFLRQTFDCEINLRLTGQGLDSLPQELRGLIESVACAAPLSFAKREVYEEWIGPDRFELPPLDLVCTIGVAGEAIAIAPRLVVSCVREGGKWRCAPKLSRVERLGVVGTILARAVETDPRVRQALADALAGLE